MWISWLFRVRDKVAILTFSRTKSVRPPLEPTPGKWASAGVADCKAKRCDCKQVLSRTANTRCSG
jgi:hypothetical protein